MKDVQANGDVEEDELEEMVCFLFVLRVVDISYLWTSQLVKAKEQHERDYVAKAKESKEAKAKVLFIFFFCSLIAMPIPASYFRRQRGKEKQTILLSQTTQ